MPEVLNRHPAVLLLFLALALVEYGWRTRWAGRGYDRSAAAASLGVALGQMLLKPLSAGIIGAAFIAAHALAPVKLPISDWRVWIAGFFAVEFAYYWLHRWSHTVNWLWATHAVHHSANEMTLPAAIRLGWTGALSGGWLVFVPLILIGFPPFVVATLLGVNLLFQFTLHTEAIGKLGWLEHVFNTPSRHRAHHSADTPFLDCNFGGVLIIFDTLFGTLRTEPDGGGLRYGLVKPIRSNNPFRIAFYQWRAMLTALAQATSWRRRFETLFGRPDSLDRVEVPVRTARTMQQSMR